MIISHKNRFVFFKPMKTAGSSIEEALTSRCGKQDILTGTAYLEEIDPASMESIREFSDFENALRSQNNLHHVPGPTGMITLEPIFNSHTTVDELREKYEDFYKIENYLKFSVVRNPWDVFISYFWWSFYGYKTIGEKYRSNYDAHESIKPMVFDTSAVLRAKFQNFCESFLNLDSVDMGLKMENDKVIDWFARTQQSFFVNDSIDYVIKFENLQNDFNKICNQVNLPSIELPRLKSKIRKSKIPYSNYYNDYTMDLVGEYFYDTIVKFDYKPFIM